MQMMYVIYILVLNAVLTKFSDAAVTVLGLYYKLQTFFFIPMFGLQTCIVPVISYNFARHNFMRAKKVMNDAMLITAVGMILGIICFEAFPKTFIGLFSKDEQVLAIGQTAFRIIGTSFIPVVFSLMIPMFFQAIGRSVPSIALSLIRQVLGLMPLFYAFSFIGLDYTWIAFPVSETMTTIVGLILYVDQLKSGSVKSGSKRNERVRQRKIASVRAKSKRRATNRHCARKRIKCTIIHTNVSLYNYCLTF